MSLVPPLRTSRVWSVLLLALLLPSSAAAVIRNQNTSVTYATIQQAVDAAAAGHVILVDAGTYPEAVTINKTLTIQRNGAGVATIDPPGSANGVTITGASVTLRDLRITGAAYGVSASAGASLALTLERVDASSNTQNGVLIQNYLVAIVSQGTFSNNGTHGIAVSELGTFTVTGVTASNNAGVGIFGGQISNSFTIATSTIANNGSIGLVGANNSRMGGCTLNDVTFVGAPGLVSGFNFFTVWVTGVAETSADTLTLTSTSFDARPGGVQSGTLQYDNIGTLAFELYGGNDTVTVNSSAAGTSTTISTGDGHDSVMVGSGTLDGILGTVSVFGGTDTDTLTISDSGDSSPGSYAVSTSSIGRSLAPGITYNSTIELITLSTTPQDDLVNVAGTSTRVDVFLNNGNDTLYFSVNGASLSGGNVFGGAGTDTLNYFGYTSPVAVSLSNDILLQGTLSQAQEVPPSGSTATGGVLMVYTTLGAIFDMRVAVNNLAAASVTGDHIHAAAAGANGPIIVDLAAAAPWQTTGSSIVKILTGVGFPSGSVSALVAGNTYVNVHTATFPSGAVRAQLGVTVPANSATGTGGATQFEAVLGGSGNDLILGSSVGDSLYGRGGNDLIFGRGGDDLIYGDAGDDLLFGDSGDDFFVWSSGEGSDIFEGGAGSADRLVFNGSDTQNDAISLRMNGGRILAARTNLTPATHDLSGVEIFDVHGRGGDDFYNIEPLIGASIGVFGGANNDTLVYDALCSSVNASSTLITHPTRGYVLKLETETTTFTNRTELTPGTTMFSSAGGNGTIGVMTGASCAWNTVSTMPWLQITGGATGTGNGTVSYRVVPNMVPAPRTASVVVAGGAASVQQTARSMSLNSPYDFNGDGTPDLLLHHSTDGSIAAWYMNERVLIDGALLNPPQVSDLQWQVAGMGDFNSDGHVDILWQRIEDGSLAVWLMNGINRIDVQYLMPARLPERSWRVRAVRDMNADGKPDLIIQHITEGLVGVWYMNGLLMVDGRLFNPDRTSIDWTIVGAADLNADGKPDLVFQHNDGALAAWFMDGATRLDVVFFTPAMMGDPTWRIKGMMDLNGDGQSDLLMQHPDGRMAAFLLNGTTLVDGVLFIPPQTMDNRWRLVGPR